MNKPTNQVEILHPIFNDVKPEDLKLTKQSQILIVLQMRTTGYSYNQISRRLFAEHNITISPQRVAQIVNKHGEKYGRYQEL
jgi:predicted transposase YdaD